jgi:hypothetical protein
VSGRTATRLKEEDVVVSVVAVGYSAHGWRLALVLRELMLYSD